MCRLFWRGVIFTRVRPTFPEEKWGTNGGLLPPFSQTRPGAFSSPEPVVSWSQIEPSGSGDEKITNIDDTPD